MRVGSVYEALVAGDGGPEGLRCPAVEGARVAPDPGGGGCPGVGLGSGGGWLVCRACEGGPVQPVVQYGAQICPAIRPPLLGVSHVCPCV